MLRCIAMGMCGRVKRAGSTQILAWPRLMALSRSNQKFTWSLQQARPQHNHKILQDLVQQVSKLHVRGEEGIPWDLYWRAAMGRAALFGTRCSASRLSSR